MSSSCTIPENHLGCFGFHRAESDTVAELSAKVRVEESR
jgi:hypothetical protein